MAKRGRSSWLEDRKAERQAAKVMAQRRAEIEATRENAFRGVPPVAMTYKADVAVSGDLIGASVTFDGRLIVASSKSDADTTFASRDEVSPSQASFPHSMAQRRYSIDVTVIGGGSPPLSIGIEDLPVAHPHAQLMPDGRVLLVGSRAYFRDGEGEHNALLFTPGEATVTSFCIGDGVSSVQVDGVGRIWAGYFDEGVFGNFGWGHPDSAPPLGRSGLVCWSDTGERLYEFVPPDGCGPIDDCYALNVDANGAWVCYYSDFPIVSVGADFTTRGWLGDTGGAHSIAVGSAGRAALIGGYGGLFDRMSVLEIGTEVMTASSTMRLVLPSGDRLPEGSRILARGSSIHAVANRQWLRLDIDGVDA